MTTLSEINEEIAKLNSAIKGLKGLEKRVVDIKHHSDSTTYEFYQRVPYSVKLRTAKAFERSGHRVRLYSDGRLVVDK